VTEALTLFCCALCGIPVEISAHDAEALPHWEKQLGRPIVVHCLSCADSKDRG